MRILLVGTASERARLRAEMNGSMEVVGEYATLAAARAADLDVDAIVLPFDSRDSGLAQGRPFDSHDAELAQGRVPADSAPDAFSTRREAFDSLDDELAQAETLTPREIEVLERLAEGLPNKAIAERLRISDQTVKFHVSSISGKLGAANRTDAVRRAVRRGLITL
jgi:DNA-binding CsgD family transcriptional regulator